MPTSENWTEVDGRWFEAMPLPRLCEHGNCQRFGDVELRKPGHEPIDLCPRHARSVIRWLFGWRCHDRTENGTELADESGVV